MGAATRLRTWPTRPSLLPPDLLWIGENRGRKILSPGVGQLPGHRRQCLSALPLFPAPLESGPGPDLEPTLCRRRGASRYCLERLLRGLPSPPGLLFWGPAAERQLSPYLRAG